MGAERRALCTRRGRGGGGDSVGPCPEQHEAHPKPADWVTQAARSWDSLQPVSIIWSKSRSRFRSYFPELSRAKRPSGSEGDQASRGVHVGQETAGKYRTVKVCSSASQKSVRLA